jgi:hypothetical protein
MNTAAHHGASGAGEPITARLFSVDGRMTVTVLDLFADAAIAITPTPPPAGSIAVVARNCVRLAATVTSAEGGRFMQTLDEPLDGRRREQFVGSAREPRQPARVAAAA